jgi:hypothetical protein
MPTIRQYVDAEGMKVVDEWLAAQNGQHGRIKRELREALRALKQDSANWDKPYFKQLRPENGCHLVSEILFGIPAPDECSSPRKFRGFGLFRDNDADRKDFVICTIEEKRPVAWEEPGQSAFYRKHCTDAKRHYYEEVVPDFEGRTNEL